MLSKPYRHRFVRPRRQSITGAIRHGSFVMNWWSARSPLSLYAFRFKYNVLHLPLRYLRNSPYTVQKITPQTLFEVKITHFVTSYVYSRKSQSNAPPWILWMVGIILVSSYIKLDTDDAKFVAFYSSIMFESSELRASWITICCWDVLVSAILESSSHRTMRQRNYLKDFSNWCAKR